MNIASFLTPKSEVVYLKKKYSIKRTLEILSKNKFTSVPVIDDDGKYVGAISEGDLLWFINERRDLRLDQVELSRIKEVPRRFDIKEVKINARISSLVKLVAVQNFVPVVDDEGVFIGIIKRSDILEMTMEMLGAEEFLS